MKFWRTTGEEKPESLLRNRQRYGGVVLQAATGSGDGQRKCAPGIAGGHRHRGCPRSRNRSRVEACARAARRSGAAEGDRASESIEWRDRHGVSRALITPHAARRRRGRKREIGARIGYHQRN